MIKRTLYFGNPAQLSLRYDQMQIKIPSVEKNQDLPEIIKSEATTSIPIEDIGVIILDHQQITITHGLLESLLANNTAIITCDSKHMPIGLMLPLAGNTLQSERFKEQLEASEPLRKQLWQQTIRQKILNQAALLSQKGINTKNMLYWAKEVKSGDSENHESRAAAYYWTNLFPADWQFKRDPEGLPPNNLLNYGYAILRAIIARSLVASGLLPTLGIHHHNRYNAYCLADDIMEPYRPMVDALVCDYIKKNADIQELNKSIKAHLLTLPTIDVIINERRSPLMIAALQTTASLAQCFTGNLRKISYPSFAYDKLRTF